MVAAGASPTARAGREVACFLVVVLASRLALLVAVGHLVHGQEISDDSGLQLWLARHPFRLLTDTGADYSQYPALFGLMLWPVVTLAGRALPDFYTVRLAAISWELVAAGLFAWGLHRTGTGTGDRMWSYLAWLVVPMTWATSTVMGQKDCVGAAFVAGALLLASSGRWGTASGVAGVGVVAAKVFLGVPLLVIVILAPPHRRLRAAAAGAGPVVVVYGWLLLLGAVQHHGLALARFHPAAPFGTQAWTLLSLHLRLASATESRISGVLALAGVAAVLWAWGRSRGRLGAQQSAPLALVVASATLAVFSLFYHVNDSYFTLLVPAVLLPVVVRRRPALLGVSTVAPWAVNFFYGVKTAAADRTAGGKHTFVRLYHDGFGSLSPNLLLQMALALTAASWAVLCVQCLRDGLRADAPTRTW